MTLKPRQRRWLEEDAKNNSASAQILKSIQQEEAKAVDLMRQASEQTKKDMNRQKILIGVAMLAECDQSPAFRERLEKVLAKHLTATRDKELMAKFGWELGNEKIENNTAATSPTAISE